MSAAEQSSEDRPAPVLARVLTRIDGAVGLAEQAVLVVALAVLIVAGAYQAIATNVLGRGDSWPFELIRYSVFTIALIGAAFAAHRRQQIAMDVLSRLLSARARAVTEIVIAVVVAALCVIVGAEGEQVVQQSISLEARYELISPEWGLIVLPLGFRLIAFHVLVHALVNLAFLLAGRTPPARDHTPAH